MEKWEVFRLKRDAVVKRYLEVKRRHVVLMKLYIRLMTQKLLKHIIRVINYLKNEETKYQKKRGLVFLTIYRFKCRMRRMYPRQKDKEQRNIVRTKK